MTEENQLDEIRRICGDSVCAGRGTYSLRGRCYNCNWKGTVTLTKGHSFLTVTCPNCGCDEVRKV